MMDKKLKIKRDFSAGGIVWDRKRRKLLMVLVENLLGQKVWTFPKGHPDGQETARQAALREVREETGWDCEILRKITDVRYRYAHKGVLVKKTVRWFLMRPLKKTGAFDPDEVLRCRWFDRSAARSRVVYRSDQSLLRRLVSFSLHYRSR